MAEHPLMLGVVLFPDFELLDVFGPLEVLGHLQDAFRTVLIGPAAGPVASIQGPPFNSSTARREAPPHR